MNIEITMPDGNVIEAELVKGLTKEQIDSEVKSIEAKYMASVGGAKKTETPAPKTVEKGGSKLAPKIAEAGSSIAGPIWEGIKTVGEMALQVPNLIGQTVSPTIAKLQEEQGEDFSMMSPEYLKAAGQDVLLALPFLAAPFGATLPATASKAAQVAYPIARGAAEAGITASGRSALGDESAPNTTDAMLLGGALGGGAAGAVAGAGKALSLGIPFARNAMAKMANVSPEALAAYSSGAGRANIAQAFGNETEIAKDLTDMAGPAFMEYMPETAAFNEIVGQLKTPTNLGQFAKDLYYNPTLARGGGGLYEGQQLVKEEVEKFRTPLMNKAKTEYRVVSPAQLNAQRKDFARQLDNAWNEINKGVPAEAANIGKKAYAEIRNRLIEIADREGMDEAKKLLAAQAKKLGARDDFLRAWAGGRTDKRDVEKAIGSKVAGVLAAPSPNKIYDYKQLKALDNAIGTDYATAVADASYARQLASAGATPGNFSASIFPKYVTGAWKPTAPLLGGSPITGGRYLENLNALQAVTEASKGRTSPFAGLASPFLMDDQEQ